ncbi:hypothetical protein JN085_29100 [Mycolicibacterium austroafricanum]|nr:hypothetical protein JN085_29100 [Mycolicibacterium austroafricanum]
MATKAFTAVALWVALAGLGAGVAEGKPMERHHAKYCAKIISDYKVTWRIYGEYLSKYGPDDALTIQAYSNYDRAAEAHMNSGC